MKATYVQLGEAIDFLPSQSVSAGEILVCNGIAGVVRTAVGEGELGTLHLTGVYDVEKCQEEFACGDRVYWDRVAGLATRQPSAGVFLGMAAGVSPARVPRVRVVLNFGHPDVGGGGSSEGIEWQAMKH